MRAYKWMTKDMKAFYDGYQFRFGWNKQNGQKNGQVCVSGGFHITTDPNAVISIATGKYEPTQCLLTRYEVYYRKRDILGQSGINIRISEFKILKKKPVIINGKDIKQNQGHNIYYYPTAASSGTTFNWDSNSDTSDSALGQYW